MALKLFIFLILNFLALAIGGFFTGSGVSSEWYQTMNQAPWTPPGWVFGFAWTSIMILFSFYMASVYQIQKDKKGVLLLYALQWILNVSWNPIFFYFKLTGIGLILITLLLFIITVFLTNYYFEMGKKSWLLVPYFVWLLIATSLNAYILIYN